MAAERKVSLRLKVAVSFSVLLLILGGVTAAVLMRYEASFLEEEGGKRAFSLALSLAAASRDPMLAADDLRLGPLVESAIQDREVRYACLEDHQGRILYQAPPRTSIPPRGPGGERLIQARAPILVEGVQVGIASVGLSRDHIREALVATAVGILPPFLVAGSVGILAIILLSKVHVERVERLAKAMGAVGEGDLSVRVRVIGRDEVADLARHFNRMVEQVQDSKATVERHFRETVGALAAAVEAKDAYTRGHCDRVARLCRAVGERLGFDLETLEELELAAILHDVGKIGMEGELLDKEGPLEKEERDRMKDHPEVGERILAPLSEMESVAAFVRHHHERWDGSGYPDGLRGDAIPGPSRVIGLVDAFDAMVTDRSYRRALSPEEAGRRIRNGIGTQFDPAVVGVFLGLMEEGVVSRIQAEVCAPPRASRVRA